LSIPGEISVSIVDLSSLGVPGRQQAAEILVAAFRSGWPDAWPGMAEGLEEVDEALGAERISRAAVDEHGRVLGWIGGIPSYRGRAWELHPLAVHPEFRRRGVARALLAAMLDGARRRGVELIFLEVRPTNAEAIGLYGSFGFQVIGRRKGYYFDTGEDALVMEAKLATADSPAVVDKQVG